MRLEDDAERVVEVLGHRIEGKHAGLHDTATQAAFDDDLATDAAIHGNPGGKGRQAEETETRAQGSALPVAGRDPEGGSSRSHAIEVDKTLNFRFVIFISDLCHFINLLR